MSYHRDIAEGFQSGLQDAVLSYSEDEEKANALDAIQRALRCCGVHSYRDWLESPWSMEQQEQCQSPPQTSNGSVPTSCCQVRSGCRNSPLLPGAPGIHWDGCFKKVCDFDPSPGAGHDPDVSAGAMYGTACLPSESDNIVISMSLSTFQGIVQIVNVSKRGLQFYW
ncbi:hypothetical protein FKM82_026483 [Ascaphus truei]